MSTMAEPNDTNALLDELTRMDGVEDSIMQTLLRKGAELDEARRRSRMVTVGDTRALRDGLAALEQAIDDVQARVTRAEAASAAPMAPTTNGVAAAVSPPAPNGAAAAAPPAAQQVAPPPAPVPALQPSTPAPTFEELAARVHAAEAESDAVRTQLRNRLIELGAAESAHVEAAVTAAAPGLTPTFATDPALAPEPLRTLIYRPHAPMRGADVSDLQRDLNRRFERWSVHIRVHEDGTYGKATRHATRQVLLGLGAAPADYAHGITAELRAWIRTPSGRSDRQKAHGAAYLKRLRAHAPASREDKMRRLASGTRAPGGGGLAATIDKHGGCYGELIVREAGLHRLDVALVCAVVQCESSFRNVFGGDAVRGDQTHSPANGPKIPVTHALYRQYLARRARLGRQGVGPMQLTNAGLQDQADLIGGCWQEDANIQIGCKNLRDQIDQYGKHRGIRAYNDGSGTKDESKPYLTKVLAVEADWHKRLAGIPAGGEATKHPADRAGKGTPVTFRLTHPPMKSDSIRSLQRELNDRLAIWKVRTHVEQDGEYGPRTRQAARQVLYGLGITTQFEFAGGITPQMRSLIRDPGDRTDQMLARAKQRRPWLAKLAKRSARRVSRARSLKARASNAVGRSRHGIRIKGNTVTGGTPRARVVAAARHTAWLDSAGKRHSFYSQSGGYSVSHGITGEPRGFRSDCSQWVTAMYHAAGVRCPDGNNYGGGYTGTLSSTGKHISRAQLKPGDLVLYGPAPHHHVEMYVGPGDKTLGHGDARVNGGAIGMMRDAHFVTYPWLD